MRAFRFSLQRVLDVKQLLEEQQRQALAAARARTEATSARLEDARLMRAAALQEDAENDQVEPWLRELGWRRRERLLSRVRQLAMELEEALRLEDDERQKLIVRYRERRVLERLSEKHRREHDLREARREQAILDEAATNRWSRPLVGGVRE